MVEVFLQLCLWRKRSWACQGWLGCLYLGWKHNHNPAVKCPLSQSGWLRWKQRSHFTPSRRGVFCWTPRLLTESFSNMMHPEIYNQAYRNICPSKSLSLSPCSYEIKPRKRQSVETWHEVFAIRMWFCTAPCCEASQFNTWWQNEILLQGES